MKKYLLGIGGIVAVISIFTAGATGFVLVAITGQIRTGAAFEVDGH